MTKSFYLCSVNKSLIHKQLNIPYMFANIKQNR